MKQLADLFLAGEDRIDRIRRRLAGRTPGPWRAEICDGEPLVATRIGDNPKLVSIACASWVTPRQVEGLALADAVFIAHAPEDIEFLIDSYEAAMARSESESKATARIQKKLDNLLGGMACVLCQHDHQNGSFDHGKVFPKWVTAATRDEVE